ncbi:unnamed protein product [Macrosiphum euphorbiae]|uniref:LAGLIDADG homing endonuclease n=1 Tax=Macrosiphum euphorbiae TaxID=13131 RepID=A0AAV0X4B4_9HEMI|nr:unnamed protein product [Macrosiphum euphorbiae]
MYLRLPLISKNYILNKVVKEPLYNNCLKCKYYVIEALQFNLIKSDGSLSYITAGLNLGLKIKLFLWFVDQLQGIVRNGTTQKSTNGYLDLT